jgi:hypothetical protein
MHLGATLQYSRTPTTRFTIADLVIPIDVVSLAQL